MDRQTCAGCRKEAPETETDYTLTLARLLQPGAIELRDP
jgi:hypothetical protein